MLLSSTKICMNQQKNFLKTQKEEVKNTRTICSKIYTKVKNKDHTPDP